MPMKMKTLHAPTAWARTLNPCWPITHPKQRARIRLELNQLRTNRGVAKQASIELEGITDAVVHLLENQPFHFLVWFALRSASMDFQQFHCMPFYALPAELLR